MGIVRLADVIKEEAAEAVSSFPLQQYRDRVIALDASIAIYQFRTAMPKIFNRNGENISHLQGLFYRTLHLLENGIKPVFVFDGRPPDLKQPLLARRAEAARARRDAAESRLAENLQRPLKQDCETLLSYLGVPCVQAPAEAEATCAALVKSGKVWCTATEDMDALPFGSLRLIRHLSAKKSCSWTCASCWAVITVGRSGGWAPRRPSGCCSNTGPSSRFSRTSTRSESRVCRRLQRWHEAQPKPKEAQPKQQVPREGRRQRKLGDFFPASKRARPPEVPSPRPSRKRQKLQAGTSGKAGSPEPGK
ncbi:flap endonuclease 1-like isoform X3 [Eretmochelys imbricata]